MGLSKLHEIVDSNHQFGFGIFEEELRKEKEKTTEMVNRNVWKERKAERGMQKSCAEENIISVMKPGMN